MTRIIEKFREVFNWMWGCIKKYLLRSFTYKNYSISRILNMQYSCDEFDRFDIIVRLLAIENEMGLNSYGWDYYKKMQAARNDETINDIEIRVNRFKNLIYNKIDYTSIPIVLDEKLKLYDGAHRIALGLYYNRKMIKCVIDHDIELSDADYGLLWFVKHGFDGDEIKKIVSRTRQLFNSINTMEHIEIIKKLDNDKTLCKILEQ